METNTSNPSDSTIKELKSIKDLPVDFHKAGTLGYSYVLYDDHWSINRVRLKLVLYKLKPMGETGLSSMHVVDIWTVPIIANATPLGDHHPIADAVFSHIRAKVESKAMNLAYHANLFDDDVRFIKYNYIKPVDGDISLIIP